MPCVFSPIPQKTYLASSVQAKVRRYLQRYHLSRGCSNKSADKFPQVRRSQCLGKQAAGCTLTSNLFSFCRIHPSHLLLFLWKAPPRSPPLFVGGTLLPPPPLYVGGTLLPSPPLFCNSKPKELQRTARSHATCITNCSLCFLKDFNNSICTKGAATCTEKIC